MHWRASVRRRADCWSLETGLRRERIEIANDTRTDTHMLLETIDSPADLRALERGQLPLLARELREFVLGSVSRTGGHLSSNLGTIALTIRLHYVYDTPRDS